MNRRQFLRAGTLSVASLLTKRAIQARPHSPEAQLMRYPDVVTAILDDKAIRLLSSGDSQWKYRDLVVVVREEDSILAVEVTSPSARLSEVTLHWKMERTPSSQVLNDHWERTYGNASWHTPQDDEILPWYFMEHSRGSTFGYGVMTGARSMCYWKLQEKMLTLTLDTRSGGNGVQLGER